MTAKRCAACLSTVLIAMDVVGALAQADTQGEIWARCHILKSSDFSDIPDAPAQITESNLLNATGDVPSHCQVQGYVAPQVGFEIRLPASKWNGKFLKVGCGGTCGELMTKYGVCNGPLRKGYACLVSDMGHTGRGGLWAFNNPQAEIDFAYRATHVATLAGKAITERYYRSEPEKSYFMGCSTGGRQGMVEAQRFPWDFDGIIVNAPTLSPMRNQMNWLWGNRAITKRNGKRLLGEKELDRLNQAVLNECDLNDGLKDGLLEDPRACVFDPSSVLCAGGKTTECLTDEQIAAAKRVYGGPTTSEGVHIYIPGAMPGSERTWSVLFADRESYKGFEDIFRYLSFQPDLGPRWRSEDFDFDRDYKRLGIADGLYEAVNPDLRRFKAVGGKLLAMHGWNDALGMPLRTVDYYETVERTMGGREATQDFFRLFMLPGVGHCAGGPGADAVDLLGSLEAWVERGQAPDRILSAHVDKNTGLTYPYRDFPADSTKVTFTRPVYPYPRRAMYKGGDPNDSLNFRPVEP